MTGADASLPANFADYLAAGGIPHDGGPCPVPLDSKPGVLFRDGIVKDTGHVPAREWTKGDWWQWHGRRIDNIVAYLPDPNYPPQTEQPDPLDTIRAAVERIRARGGNTDDLNAIDAALVRLEQENG